MSRATPPQFGLDPPGSNEQLRLETRRVLARTIGAAGARRHARAIPSPLIVCDHRPAPRRPEPYQLLRHVLGSESAPDSLRALIRQRVQALEDVLRQLITAGQVAGEVAAGDVDQLVRAVLTCVEGL